MFSATALQPLMALIPGALGPGASSTVPSSVTTALRHLPEWAASAIHGDSGDAIAAKLAEGRATVEQLTHAGRELDEIAHRAQEVVARLSAEITAIAQRCLAEVAQIIVTSAASGPAGLLAPARVEAAVQAHLAEAQARLQRAGEELAVLTEQVRSVVVSQVPGAPVVGDIHPAAAGDPGSAGPSEDLGHKRGHMLGAPGAPSDAAAGLSSHGGHAAPGAPSPQAAAAVAAALSARGTPYSWGGTAPGVGMDCSGLTQWAYAQAGVEIPRLACDQAVGPQIPRDQLAPGDLAVWDGHVAMVVGDGMMIEAGDPVELSPIRTDNCGMGFRGFYRPTAA